ncbi:hypothetical protein ACL9RL_04630 [Plantibacter sp. Mn2098]|uniref:hypothetical protein n=1 Tax=Plantibacter sp. Mn2098 TaxID=3395266 RepID=UPI003BCDC74A
MTTAPPTGPTRLGPHPAARNAALIGIVSAIAGIAIALVIQPFYGQDFSLVVIVSVVLFAIIAAAITIAVSRAYRPILVDFNAGICSLDGETVALRDVTTAWRRLQRDPLSLNFLSLNVATADGRAGRLIVTGVLMRGLRTTDLPTIERFIEATSIADPDAATIAAAAAEATAQPTSSDGRRRRRKKPRPPRIPMGKQAIIAMLHNAADVLEDDTTPDRS